MQEYNLELFADYSQFYLQDESQEELLLDWTEEETNRLVALAPKTIGIGTARNTTIPIIIQVYQAPLIESFEAWDKVFECSIDVPSGKLVVAGCTDYLPDAARIKIEAGMYRVRIYHGGLHTLRENDLEGDDHYKIALWPAALTEPEVLKSTEREA